MKHWFAWRRSREADVKARFDAALGWIKTHALATSGIQITNLQKTSYPEVTGYFIPTLLHWGERDLAVRFSRWLISIQKPDGSWSGSDGGASYTFDTGQILKGLMALADYLPECEEPIIRGCDWLLSQIQDSGRVVTPDKSQWRLSNNKLIPEAIHLYALEPLRAAGRKWTLKKYSDAVERAITFYRSDKNLTEFNALSHFHAYIIEALVDLGYTSQAHSAMLEIARFQKKNGAVPAYADTDWICSTGLLQYCLIWYKLGHIERAERAFAAACSLQNKSGGFYGSYGKKAAYFPDQEISWAVKYFLDALWWKIKTSFNASVDVFPDSIAADDGRYQLIANEVPTGRPGRILDAGCGKGRFVRQLKAAYPNIDAWGLDFSEKMLAFLPHGINALQGSLLNIPCRDAFFDFTFCVEALEHAVNISGAIREMVRILRPGGTLVIIDKNVLQLGKLKISEWEQWFTEDEITGLLQACGCEVAVHHCIPYDGHDGSDGLFLGWVARKHHTISQRDMHD